MEHVPRLTALPLAGAVRGLVELMVEAHSVDPKLHQSLIEGVPRVGRLAHLTDIERDGAKLVQLYLESRRDEIRPMDFELGAYVAVQTIETLTHAAVLHSPERLADGRLVDEMATLLIRYFAPDPSAAKP